ncbi:MAG: hypothetical protein N4A76_10525 [Firmicutes bacterium]|nr:hypothetical protein [Bacillota bacterium]
MFDKSNGCWVVGEEIKGLGHLGEMGNRTIDCAGGIDFDFQNLGKGEEIFSSSFAT